MKVLRKTSSPALFPVLFLGVALLLVTSSAGALSPTCTESTHSGKVWEAVTGNVGPAHDQNEEPSSEYPISITFKPDPEADQSSTDECMGRVQVEPPNTDEAGWGSVGTFIRKGNLLVMQTDGGFAKSKAVFVGTVQGDRFRGIMRTPNTEETFRWYLNTTTGGTDGNARDILKPLRPGSLIQTESRVFTGTEKGLNTTGPEELSVEISLLASQDTGKIELKNLCDSTASVSGGSYSYGNFADTGEELVLFEFRGPKIFGGVLNGSADTISVHGIMYHRLNITQNKPFDQVLREVTLKNGPPSEPSCP